MAYRQLTAALVAVLACALIWVPASDVFAQSAQPSNPSHTFLPWLRAGQKTADKKPNLTRCRYEVPEGGSMLYFDHFGVSEYTPSKEFEEGDKAEIVIISRPEMVDRIRIARTSPLPDPDSYRFAGIKTSPITLTSGAIDTTASGDEADSCALYHFATESLNGGLNDFQIDYLKEDGSGFVELGEFSVPAARKYAGIATFGVVASWLEDRSFSLVPETPSDSSGKVVSINVDDQRFRYVLGLSPFMFNFDLASRDWSSFGERPIQPGSARFSLSPYVGFDLEKPFDNLYLGGVLGVADIVYISGGWHVGRVTRLADGLAFEGGEAYVGDSIPTVEKLESGFYLGVTADARLAISALGGLIGGLAK